MGDTSKREMTTFQTLIETELKNSVYTYLIQIGKTEKEEFNNSFFKHSEEQIELACAQLTTNPELKNGFNLIGFSQGGQLARGLVQRCDLPRPLSLITLGGQHQGVYGLPRCISKTCNIIRNWINFGAYKSFFQNRLVQAQYWHDPLHEKEYILKSQFLADINNERRPRNNTYRKRLMSLERFVMVQFDDDTIVIPKETSLFGFYESGQTKKVVPLEQTLLYTEDWLGLRELDSEQRLIQLHCPGNHLHVKDQWFIDQIIKPFLMDSP
jgi:palmitoyl-protein thioesterase